MAPPDLVVEVVSPGEVQRDRDYIAKRAQYEPRGIPEYWLVNPELKLVVILGLQTGQYTEVGTFGESERIVSPSFPALNLGVNQVFAI